MDRGRDVVLAGKLRFGHLDLLEPDAPHALADRLLQFEPIGHASNRIPRACGPFLGQLRGCRTQSNQSFATVTIYRKWLMATQRASRSRLFRTCSAPPRLAIAHARLGVGMGEEVRDHCQAVCPRRQHALGPLGRDPPIATKGSVPICFFQRATRSSPCGAHFMTFSRVS